MENNNKRRVTKSIKVMQPDGKLLCTDSMYGGQAMDGKLKVLKLKSTNKLEESHYVETSNGVTCAEFFTFLTVEKEKGSEGGPKI